MGAGRGVRLLLDENISRRLVPALQSAYPGTTQVAIAGLERASDREIWDYAKNGDYVIVTKDEDFLGLLSLLRLSAQSRAAHAGQLHEPTYPRRPDQHTGGDLFAAQQG